MREIIRWHQDFCENLLCLLLALFCWAFRDELESWYNGGQNTKEAPGTMPEISQEMQRELANELFNDAERIKGHASWLANTVAAENLTQARQMHLEQITYITEQMRLKLKILGAPHIWN